MMLMRPLRQAFVESWIDFSTNEIDGPLCSWIYPLFGYVPYDKKVLLYSVVSSPQ